MPKKFSGNFQKSQQKLFKILRNYFFFLRLVFHQKGVQLQATHVKIENRRLLNSNNRPLNRLLLALQGSIRLLVGRVLLLVVGKAGVLLLYLLCPCNRWM